MELKYLKELLDQISKAKKNAEVLFYKLEGEYELVEQLIKKEENTAEKEEKK